MHFILKLQKSLYPAFNLHYFTEFVYDVVVNNCYAYIG